MQDYPRTITLKNGRSIMLRLLSHDDSDALHAFFVALPEEDLLFLRHDVRNPELVRGWMRRLDTTRDIALVGMDGDTLVATGRLEIISHGWMQHVGHARVITAQTYRRRGLGGLISRELVHLAVERHLEKLQVHVIEDNVSAVRMCEAIGFEKAAVLRGMVKDQSGRLRNLAIMVNDVADLGQRMEEWFQETMIPAYRVPGGGA